MPPKSLLPVFAFFVFYVHSKKSTEQMKKVPTIVLSVSYKGVKFIDATNKVRLSIGGWLSHNSLTELILLLIMMREAAFL